MRKVVVVGGKVGDAALTSLLRSVAAAKKRPGGGGSKACARTHTLESHCPYTLYVADLPGVAAADAHAGLDPVRALLARADAFVEARPVAPRWAHSGATEHDRVHPAEALRWVSVLSEALAIAKTARSLGVRLPPGFVELTAVRWHADLLHTLHTEVRENIQGCILRGTSIAWLQWLVRAYSRGPDSRGPAPCTPANGASGTGGGGAGGWPPAIGPPAILDGDTWRWACTQGLSPWVAPPSVHAVAEDLETALDVIERTFPARLDYRAAQGCLRTLGLARAYLEFIERAAQCHALATLDGDAADADADADAGTKARPVAAPDDVRSSQRAALVLLWAQRSVAVAERFLAHAVAFPRATSLHVGTGALGVATRRARARLYEWARARVIESSGEAATSSLGDTFWADFVSELVSVWGVRPSDGRAFAQARDIASGSTGAASWTEVWQQTHGVNEVRFWFTDATGRHRLALDPEAYTSPDDLVPHLFAAARALFKWRAHCVVPAKTLFEQEDRVVRLIEHLPLVLVLPWWQPLVLARGGPQGEGIVYDASEGGTCAPHEAMWNAVALWLALVHTQHSGKGFQLGGGDGGVARRRPRDDDDPPARARRPRPLGGGGGGGGGTINRYTIAGQLVQGFPDTLFTTEELDEYMRDPRALDAERHYVALFARVLDAAGAVHTSMPGLYVDILLESRELRAAVPRRASSALERELALFYNMSNAIGDVLHRVPARLASTRPVEVPGQRGLVAMTEMISATTDGRAAPIALPEVYFRDAQRWALVPCALVVRAVGATALMPYYVEGNRVYTGELDSIVDAALVHSTAVAVLCVVMSGGHAAALVYTGTRSAAGAPRRAVVLDPIGLGASQLTAMRSRRAYDGGGGGDPSMWLATSLEPGTAVVHIRLGLQGHNRLAQLAAAGGPSGGVGDLFMCGAWAQYIAAMLLKMCMGGLATLWPDPRAVAALEQGGPVPSFYRQTLLTPARGEVTLSNGYARAREVVRLLYAYGVARATVQYTDAMADTVVPATFLLVHATEPDPSRWRVHELVHAFSYDDDDDGGGGYEAQRPRVVGGYERSSVYAAVLKVGDSPVRVAATELRVYRKRVHTPRGTFVYTYVHIVDADVYAHVVALAAALEDVAVLPTTTPRLIEATLQGGGGGGGGGGAAADAAAAAAAAQEAERVTDAAAAAEAEAVAAAADAAEAQSVADAAEAAEVAAGMVDVWGSSAPAASAATTLAPPPAITEGASAVAVEPPPAITEVASASAVGPPPTTTEGVSAAEAAVEPPPVVTEGVSAAVVEQSSLDALLASALTFDVFDVLAGTPASDAQ